MISNHFMKYIKLASMGDHCIVNESNIIMDNKCIINCGTTRRILTGLVVSS